MSNMNKTKRLRQKAQVFALQCALKRKKLLLDFFRNGLKV